MNLSSGWMKARDGYDMYLVAIVWRYLYGKINVLFARLFLGIAD